MPEIQIQILEFILYFPNPNQNHALLDHALQTENLPIGFNQNAIKVTGKIPVTSEVFGSGPLSTKGLNETAIYRFSFILLLPYSSLPDVARHKIQWTKSLLSLLSFYFY